MIFDKQDEIVKQCDSKFIKTEKQIDCLDTLNGTSRGIELCSPPKIFKIPYYDSKSSWATFRIHFETVKEISGWTDDKTRSARSATTSKTLCAIHTARRITYSELLNAFKSRYGDSHLEHVYRAQIKDRTH